MREGRLVADAEFLAIMDDFGLRLRSVRLGSGGGFGGLRCGGSRVRVHWGLYGLLRGFGAIGVLMTLAAVASFGGIFGCGLTRGALRGFWSFSAIRLGLGLRMAFWGFYARLSGEGAEVLEAGALLPFGSVGGEFEFAEIGLRGGSEAENWFFVARGAGGVALADLIGDCRVKAATVGEFFLVFFGLLNGFADFGFYFGAVAGVETAGAFYDGVKIVLRGFGEGEGGGGESGDFFAVNNHGDDEVAVVHLDEVAFVKGGFKLLGEDGGIIGGDTEGDGGADVTKDGVADGVSHLGDILVGNGEVEAVFARFGEDDGEGVGGEVLELVHVEVEGTAIGDVGDVGAAHRGELDLSDEEGAENGGVVFANQALREVDDQDFAFVHNLADVKAGFGLADDVTDDGVGGEGADLVEDWGDRLVDLFLVPLAEFVLPELEDGDVLAIIKGFFAKIFIGEHTGDVQQGGFGAVK